MKACNGDYLLKNQNLMEITRLEPVIIEVEEGKKISSHLILFEMKCQVGIQSQELIAEGEIQQTIYELEERNI